MIQILVLLLLLHVTVRQSNDGKLGKDKVGPNSLGRASQ